MNNGIQNNDVWSKIFGILNIGTFEKNIHRSYDKCYQLVYITQETIQMTSYKYWKPSTVASNTESNAQMENCKQYNISIKWWRHQSIDDVNGRSNNL